MAIGDDFAIIGGASDNFDCEALTLWNTVGSPQGVSLSLNSDAVQGSNAVGIRCSNTTPGVRAVYHDIIVAGDRFKITEGTLNFWFRYSKGKGATYFPNNGTAVVIRLFFGGTTDWADYQVTNNGNADLAFGYQVLQCSGRNLNGGSTSGTWSNTASNWERDIHRVELRLNFVADNQSTTNDAPLLMDCWFFGTKLEVSDGTVGGTPVELSDLFDYAKFGGSRTGFPLGLVDIDGVFATFRCGIDVGNGSDGAGNEGYLKATEAFILFNQWSAQVKHNLTVKNFSQFDSGEGEVVQGVDGNNTVAVRGCQIVLPTDREDEVDGVLPAASDIIVENGGTFRAFDTKFFRWRDLFFGAAADTTSVVELNSVRFDSCETVYIRAKGTLDLTRLEIYNNAANDRVHCAEVIATPDTCNDVLVHDCIQGIHFRDDVIFPTYRAQDINRPGGANADLAILDGKSVSLPDSSYDSGKILRLAA